jgi:phenylalanine-4-hydroxylase
MHFDSNVRVRGKITGTTRRAGALVIITWKDCTVTQGDRVLFQPEWGVFDMACGTKVVSVYGGAPDRGRYLMATEDFPQRLGFQKTNLTDENIALNELYFRARRLRERGVRPESLQQLTEIHSELVASHPHDWLLRMELLELDQLWKLQAPWRGQVLAKLAELAKSNVEIEKMIRRGMELLT